MKKKKLNALATDKDVLIVKDSAAQETALKTDLKVCDVSCPKEKVHEKNALLLASETRYRRLFEAAKDGILILDAETGMVVDVNPFLVNLLGYSREQFLGKTIWELSFLKDIIANRDNFVKLQQNGYVRYEDLPMEKSDGTPLAVEVVSNVYMVDDRNVVQCNIRDITERKLREKQQKLALRVLSLLNRESDTSLLIGNILAVTKESMGFEAVGIRLRDGDDYPYYVTHGFPGAFVEAERSLCERDAAGGIIQDTQGNPVLECMCGNVIRGRCDPSKPFFTEKGSFWSNCTTDLLASTTEEDRQSRTRNRCNGEGYESVALIALRSGDQVIGLLQLNDHRKGMFTLEMIEFFEEMGASIGIALSCKQRVEAIAALSKFPAENLNPVLRIGDDGMLIYANHAAVSRLAEWHLEPGRSVPDVLRNIAIQTADNETGQDIELECGDRLYSFAAAAIGEAGYVNLYGMDITDRKLAQDQLAYFKKAVESSSDGIGMATPDGRHYYQNGAFTELFGLTREQVDGEAGPPSTVYADEKVGQDVFTTIMRGDSWSGEVQMLDKNKRKIDIWLRAYAIKDDRGNILGLVGVHTDITKRKQMQEALAFSNIILTTQQETSLDGILVVDENGAMISHNGMFVEMWGIPVDIVESGSDESALQCVMDKLADPEEFLSKVKYLYEARNETSRDEVALKDGRTFDRYSSPMFGTDRKRYYGRVWYFRDITERKRMQEQLIKNERMNALGQMAGGIAHDFNNALMPIVGFSGLLMSDPAILDDRKEALRMINMILAAGDDARQIVRRLRTVYKKDDDTEYRMVDLSRIVASAVSLTMPKWKEEMSARDVTVEMVTDFHPVPRIRGNVSELREVMTNLIFNAVDAMRRSGAITFRLHCENNISVVLEVTDTGLGMDQETLRRCMEPLFTTKGVQGSGLGLAMVYGIVKRHDGVLEVESKSGIGTTIRMRFPVSAAQEIVETEPESQLAQISPLRVLVIDDEKASRDLVARLLESDGHYTETVEGRREGMDVCLTGNFDLIITDRAMPEISGDEVARKVQEIQPGTPVIMLTGFGDIMNDAAELPPGVVSVMSKPVTPEELTTVIASVMHKTDDVRHRLFNKQAGEETRGETI